MIKSILITTFLLSSSLLASASNCLYSSQESDGTLVKLYEASSCTEAQADCLSENDPRLCHLGVLGSTQTRILDMVIEQGQTLPWGGIADHRLSHLRNTTSSGYLGDWRNPSTTPQLRYYGSTSQNTFQFSRYCTAHALNTENLRFEALPITKRASTSNYQEVRELENTLCVEALSECEMASSHSLCVASNGLIKY